MAADRRSHILVMDDTPEILDLLRELLEDEGYRVSTSTATLALDQIKDLAPDIIVQDLLFSHTQETGWHFLTMARLDPELARLPLVLCTAATEMIGDAATVAYLDRLGVSVVRKPFDIEELLRVLDEALAGGEVSARAGAA